MLEVNFHFTESALNELTWEEIEVFEGGASFSMKKARTIMARFMVGANQQPLPYEQAYESLGRLKLGEMNAVFEKFADVLKGTAVPPVTSGG